jgi:hypothetical protein
MSKILKNSFLATFMILTSGLVSAHYHDQDPARWTIEDTTPQAHYQTLKKEAGAAYQEALAECKRQYGSEKAGCLREARTNFQVDMENAKKALRQ